jgi:hypothetical protein
MSRVGVINWTEGWVILIEPGERANPNGVCGKSCGVLLFQSVGCEKTSGACRLEGRHYLPSHLG